MTSTEPYLYGETAFHHQGDLGFLKGLVDLAAETGLRGVKFQVVVNLADFVSTKSPNFEQLTDYCLTFDQWTQAMEYAVSKNLDIVFMPLDKASFAFVDKFDFKYVEIHPVLAHNFAFVEALGALNVDISVGVGGMTLGEINKLTEMLTPKLKCLMYGFQAFPSKIEDISLGNISHLRRAFPDLEIGYADHSAADDPWTVKSLENAYLMGAEVFEKHITSCPGEKRVDWESAVGRDTLLEIADALDLIDLAKARLPRTVEDMNEAEQRYRNRRLKWVASVRISKGQLLTRNNMALKMHADPGGYSELGEIENKRVLKDVLPDELIIKHHLG